MIIGLDIDDVIFDTSAYILQVLEDISDKDLNELKLAILRGDTNIPKVRDFLYKYLPLAIENSQPKPGAAEAIQELKNSGHSIVLITARGDQVFKGTEAKNEQALTKYGIKYDQIIYNCNGKVTACKDAKIDIFIDDSPKNCLEVKEALNIPVIGFESPITAKELQKNQIKSVKNWAELKKLLEHI